MNASPFQRILFASAVLSFYYSMRESNRRNKNEMDMGNRYQRF